MNNDTIMEKSDGWKVLSLCDGMSCGQIAMKKSGLKVKEYYAAEIKEIGIKVTKHNFPNTIHIGDVTKISFSDGVLHTEKGDFEVGEIDIVMFGSPCQTFSIAIPSNQRTGLENLKKSGLFYECNRILKEVNPKYFLMENVASMKESDKKTISDFIGTEAIKIDSKSICPALRNRYYWTNIPNVTQPEEIKCDFQSILENGYTDRNKARCLAVIDSRPNRTPIKMFHRYYSTGFTTLIFKSKEHYEACVKEYQNITGGKRKIDAKMLDGYSGKVFDGVRYMTQTELERCQTVPEGYTSILTRDEAADVLGDGWTVDVIAHIFKGLKDKEKRKEEKQMELKMNEYQLPEKIEFNFDELKQELTEKVAMYETLVYTDDTIKDAKADRANLNKLKKALNDERIRREKEYMVPFNDFKAKINEIIAIIDKPCNLIDSQVKAFEEKQKADKKAEIEEAFNNTEHPDWLEFHRIFNEKWLNASTSMKAVQEDMESVISKIESDLATLSNLPEYGFEGLEVYKTSLNLNNAINEAQRMSEIAKRKAELERQIAEQEAKQKEMQTEPLPTEPNTVAVEEKVAVAVETEAPKQWIRFQAYMNMDQAKALGQYMKANGIQYKAV